MNSLVSIIAANYNCDQYIAEFIESIQRQTYSNWELIIVDDGSNDDSVEIIKKIAASDSRISVVLRNCDPKGANHCRNIGLQMSRGQYVCFFDTDDLLPTYSIEDRVVEMERNPEMDFMVFPAITFKKKPFDFNSLAMGIKPNKDDVSMFLKRYRLPFAVWTNIYKRNFLIEKGIYWDNNLMSMQDSDFNLLVLSTNVRFKYSAIRRPSYFWRQEQATSITQTIKSSKNINSQLYFYSKLKKRYYGTKYEKDLLCFKLTLLHRTIFLRCDDFPKVLLDNKMDVVKYKFVKKMISFFNIKDEKVSYFIFMMLYPAYLIQEIYIRNKNYRIVKKYFKDVETFSFQVTCK